MKVKRIVVKCTKREFTTVEFVFSYRSDANDERLIDDFVQQGEKLAEQVNPVLARNASRGRDRKTIKTNCIAGIIAEYCWRSWLNSEAKRLGLNVVVTSAVFESIDQHVDISIAYADGTSRTIEVRSSFPYTGLENAVCNVFDIIGWYVNPVKTKEVRKHYYVRTLFPFHASVFYDKLRSNSFSVFLTGGATRHLLETSPYSRDKEFVPLDDIVAILSSQLGEYRVIEPIVNAYDTVEITTIVLEKQD